MLPSASLWAQWGRENGGLGANPEVGHQRWPAQAEQLGASGAGRKKIACAHVLRARRV